MPANRGLVESSTDVVWSWLKQFQKALAYAIQKIYTLWGKFSIFFYECTRTWSQKIIKQLEISQFWHPQKRHQKPFVETCREKVLVSYGKTFFSKRNFLSFSLFFMTRTFDRWQFWCKKTPQNFFTVRIQKLYVFPEMTRKSLQIDFNIQSLRDVWTFNRNDIFYEEKIP